MNIENGGAEISQYILERNSGGIDDNNFIQVASYVGSSTASPLHTLNLATDSLVYGTIYKLRYRAVNVEGNGPNSEETLVALSSLPAAVPTPSRIESGCTTDSITISWTDMQPVT